MRRCVGIVIATLLCVAVAAPAQAAAGHRAWTALFSRTTTSVDEALVVTTTSDGSLIFTAGLTERQDYTSVIQLIAYRDDGSTAWRAHYVAPSPYQVTYVNDIVLSTDERSVILTAPSIGPDRDPMIAVGFDASTGATAWSWVSPGHIANPTGLSVTPGTVIVVGDIGRAHTHGYIAALQTDTGDMVWHQRSDSRWGDASVSSAKARAGRVVVAGSVTTREGPVLRTIAYAAADGSVDWQARFDGARGGSVIGFADHGSTVLLHAAWTIVGYDTAHGRRVLLTRLDPAWRGVIRDVTVDRRGRSVFFTGNDERAGSAHSDMLTAAYTVGSTRRRWVARFDGGGWDEGIDVVWVPSVRPEVAVTGGSAQNGVVGWRTVAYTASGGARLWSDEYRGPSKEQGYPRAVAASGDGERLYVVGYTTTARMDDFTTVAYRAA